MTTTIERRNAARTLDELIRVLTDIRECYGEGQQLYVMAQSGGADLVVEVEQSKLTDNSEVYDVIIRERYWAPATEVRQ